MLRLPRSARHTFLALAMGCLLASAPGTPALAADITLKYAFFAPEGTFPGQQMKYWAEQMAQRTQGKVKIETYAGGSLLNAREMWDGVTMGITDVGLSAPSYDPGRFPLTSGMALPLGFANATVASEILWAVTREFQPKEFEAFEIIAMFTSEPGYIMSRRPVRGTEDLKGMRLRATGSGVPVINALGGSAVGMPMPEVPQAVQTGVIDGAMTSREILKDFNLAQSLKFVTDYPMVVSTFAAVMDKRRFERLPDDIKVVIRELRDEIPGWTGRYHDNDNVQAALAWSKQEHGLTVIELTDPVKTQWDQNMSPLIEQWVTEADRRGLPGRAYIQRIETLRDGS